MPPLVWVINQRSCGFWTKTRWKAMQEEASGRSGRATTTSLRSGKSEQQLDMRRQRCWSGVTAFGIPLLAWSGRVQRCCHGFSASFSPWSGRVRSVVRRPCYLQYGRARSAD